MLTRRHFCGLLAGSLSSALRGHAAEAAQSSHTLFTIGRSKNRNVVRYLARLRDQELDTSQPIAAHWLMLAEDGRREELTWAERQLAYGFSTSRVTLEGCQLELVAFKARPLKVERHTRGFRALVPITGRPALLERIFVQTRESGLLPSVVHVDLYGQALDGTPLSERIVAR